MRFRHHIVAVLVLAITIGGCSSSAPQKTGSDEPQAVDEASPSTADDPEFSEGEHDLSLLHPAMREIISQWHGAEDHGGEIRTLTVIEDRDDLAERDRDIMSLNLLERRVDPSQPEDYCYEGTIYVEVQQGEVVSVGRYGHDCCPGTDCVMGPENWMGRLFDHSRARDFADLRDLVHPDQGLAVGMTYIDHEEDQSDTEQYHHSADELTEENWQDWGNLMSCGPVFQAGFAFSCSADDEDFSCNCHVSGISTRWDWRRLGRKAYLVRIEQTWSD